MKQPETAPKTSVQSIGRAFDIIELLSRDHQGLTLTEISVQLSLHKSTVHRLLGELLQRKYVEKESRTNTYRLGLGFVHMSGLYLSRIELKTEAEYYMRELAGRLSQVVFLAIRKDNEVVYIDKIEKYDSSRRFAIIGQRRPFYCTAIGKCLLFDEDDASLNRIFSGEQREQRTANSVVDVEALISQIHRFRSTGYSIDDEEWEYGTRCAGAPIYDYRSRVIAAISTAWNGPDSGNSVDDVGSLVRDTAQKISARLGYTGSRFSSGS